ncbi:hypothetical protein [Streptomyces sp. B6B3]|uniref:hypothetical protein n=1 Tax=Streptomyces sp. B6B3 TaxID=3153570 RepID=UPI00325C4D04
MPATSVAPAEPVRSSRARRAGDSAFGALLLVRLTFLGLLALLVVGAGAWASWDTARHAMVADGQQRGTLTLRACDREVCVGSFEPAGRDGEAGTAPEDAVLRETIGLEPGQELPVALVPAPAEPADPAAASAREAVRTGAAGVLYAWLPLTGGLLLASLVLAGGLRLYRTAWATAGLALTLLTTTFVLW